METINKTRLALVIGILGVVLFGMGMADLLTAQFLFMWYGPAYGDSYIRAISAGLLLGSGLLMIIWSQPSNWR